MSGKSTLLRTIIDLETITSGVVYIEGHDIKHENLSKQKKKEVALKLMRNSIPDLKNTINDYYKIGFVSFYVKTLVINDKANHFQPNFL